MKLDNFPLRVAEVYLLLNLSYYVVHRLSVDSGKQACQACAFTHHEALAEDVPHLEI